MPFTFSHPAAVLPLRRYGVLSALVIGSVVPDLPYFIPGVAKSNFGHTWLGLIVVCLPAGWLLFYSFQRYLKAPLWALAPAVVQQRASPVPVPLRVAPATVSILAGIATHLFLDEFTHDGTWVTRRWSFFTRPIFFFGTNYRLRGFALLQDLTTIIGFFVVAGYIVYWGFVKEPDASPRAYPPPRLIERKGLVVFMLLLGAASPAMLMAVEHPEHWLVNERRQFLEHSITLAIAIVMVELAALGLWWRQTVGHRLSRRMPGGG